VEQCGIVSFLRDGEAPRTLRDRLRAMNANLQVSRSLRGEKCYFELGNVLEGTMDTR
jgi:hypothetical protein